MRKPDWKEIGLIVTIGLNIFQYASKEAREWYVAVNQKPKASTGDEFLNIKYVDKISQETIKPVGAK